MMANPADMLTPGAIAMIVNQPDTYQQICPEPIVQVLQIKPVAPASPGGCDRYRLVISDGAYFAQSMLASEAAIHVVTEGILKTRSIVRVKGLQPSSVKGKRILVLLGVEVIPELGEPEKIGEPKPLPIEKEESNAQPAALNSNGFYGAKPQAAPKQERALPSRTGPSSSAQHGNIYPIEALSPYAHKWTIKARVTNKSEIRTWHKQSGEGKLFSVNLLDESGEIKATGFNDQCDALYDLFQEGSVYYISAPCRVNIAKKQFTNLPNDYELTFERDTVVEKAEDQDNVPQVRFNFTNIAALQTVEKDSTVDIIGVLKEVGEVSQIVSKSTNKPYDKRELTLVDDSDFSVRLTIWGKTAVSFDAQPESVVAFKGAKVSDFGGRSLSLLSSGSMSLDPDIEEAHKLRGWYDQHGRAGTFASHTGLASTGAAGGRQDPLKTVAQIRDENLGTSETPDYFSIKATIVYIRQENVAYPACSNEGCNKKVILEESSDKWRCEKCNVSHERPEYRYIMSINVNDHTGQLWLSCFDDVGRMIMGMSANDLMAMKESDEAGASQAFEDANCKTFTFKCRAKMDTFQDQQRVRYQVMGAASLNYTAEAHKLTELMKVYTI